VLCLNRIRIVLATDQAIGNEHHFPLQVGDGIVGHCKRSAGSVDGFGRFHDGLSTLVVLNKLARTRSRQLYGTIDARSLHGTLNTTLGISDIATKDLQERRCPRIALRQERRQVEQLLGSCCKRAVLVAARRLRLILQSSQAHQVHLIISNVVSEQEYGIRRTLAGGSCTTVPAAIHGEMRIVGTRIPNRLKLNGGLVELMPSGFGTPSATITQRITVQSHFSTSSLHHHHHHHHRVCHCCYQTDNNDNHSNSIQSTYSMVLEHDQTNHRARRT
jgi:hypothetical protein